MGGELKRRSRAIVFVLLLAIGLAVARTAYLGVVRGPALRRAASEEQLASETILAPRGTITDRSGVDLAISEPAQEVSADPHRVTDAYSESQKLAPLLKVGAGELDAKLSESAAGFVYLARDVPDRQAEQVEKLALPGIELSPTLTPASTRKVSSPGSSSACWGPKASPSPGSNTHSTGSSAA